MPVRRLYTVGPHLLPHTEKLVNTHVHTQNQHLHGYRVQEQECKFWWTHYVHCIMVTYTTKCTTAPALITTPLQCSMYGHTQTTIAWLWLIDEIASYGELLTYWIKFNECPNWQSLLSNCPAVEDIHNPDNYVSMYMYTYIHTHIHTCTHTYIHTYIHTHIHTYIHTYIHVHIHTYTHT